MINPAAQFTLLCLFAGLALGGLRAPWPWAWVSALICCVPLWRQLPHRMPAPKLWAAWLGWTALAALGSGELLRGLSAFSRSASYLVFFAVACGCWSASARRRWFWLLCAMGPMLGLAALLIPLPSRPMVGLLFPYSNYTACLQAAVFAAILGALGSGYPQSRPGRLLLFALLALSLTCILLARSRGALVACAAASAWGLWRRGRGWPLFFFLSALTALFSLLPLRALTPLLKLDQPGSQTRPQLWAAAAAVANDHPLLGQGPGQFERGFLRHNFPAPEGHRPTRYGLRSAHAHSEPLQTAAETGWPGLALFLAALVSSLWRARGRKGDWTRESGRLAFCAVFTMTLFDNMLFLPGLALLYFSALAVAAGDGPSRPPPLPESRMRPIWASALALACLAWWPDWAVDRFYRLAHSVPAAEGLPWMRRALRLAPEDPDLWWALARLKLRADPPDPEGALEALAEAAERHPSNALYPVARAELLRSRGAWEEVLGLAERALSLEPQCLQARMLRIEALHRLGRRAESARDWAGLRALAPGPRPGLLGYDALVLHFDVERYRFLSALLRT